MTPTPTPLTQLALSRSDIIQLQNVHGIYTAEELLAVGWWEMLHFNNFGFRRIWRIADTLESAGFVLDPPPPPAKLRRDGFSEADLLFFAKLKISTLPELAAIGRKELLRRSVMRPRRIDKYASLLRSVGLVLAP